MSFAARIPGPKPSTAGVGSTTKADGIIRFSEAVSSSLHEVTSMVHFGLVGLTDADDPTDLTKAETDNLTDVYGSPGIIGRPLPPRYKNGITEHMDVLALTMADGLVPFATRDTRLKMAGNGPSEGTFAFVGYGGGFYSLTPVVDPAGGNDPDPSGGGTLHVFYCPYAFDANGSATKAHVVTMDPTQGNESISIVHAEGMAITMLNDDKKTLLLKNASGDATFRLDDDGITMTAVQIVLSGGVIIGEPATAVPLLPGVASPGSTKLYVSP